MNKKQLKKIFTYNEKMEIATDQLGEMFREILFDPEDRKFTIRVRMYVALLASGAAFAARIFDMDGGRVEVPLDKLNKLAGVLEIPISNFTLTTEDKDDQGGIFLCFKV
jgi:hypothetical protein